MVASAGSFARVQRAVGRARPDPLTSVVLTVPVFVLYHLGILVIDVRDGVDWISGLTLWLLDESVPAYVGVTLCAAACLVMAAWIQRRRGKLRPAALFPIVAESGAWAILMAISVGWTTHAIAASDPEPALIFGAAVGGVSDLGVLDKFVLSAGAGFHEEVVFRVGLFAGGAMFLQRGAGFGRVASLAAAACVSSLLFALVHHLGPYGDAWALMPLVFRTLTGLFLSGVYLLRGFAVAVYTHAIYDALVFFVL
jgi:hypothetical protein